MRSLKELLSYLAYIAVIVQLGWSVNCTISQRISCVVDDNA